MFDRGQKSRFTDRTEAGKRLAAEISDRGVDADLVLAIPRGGLPVGREVADAIDRPLDVIVASKVGAPWNPELAIGAVGSDGSAWFDEAVIERHGIDQEYVQRKRESVAEAAAEKEARYRGEEASTSLDGSTVLLVDDGAATGSTTIAAIRLARARDAERIVLALPVAPPDTLDTLRREADEVICLLEPTGFGAVGQFYEDFGQVSDEEAIELLER
ncbi:putative phosphoribosyltransferase [Salinarchaeum sp. Harcht-Bsk1]|uniref:phosphoribosyltransferase n=1 Tax=Salinarchaeum sp. Harcht-Bsk1 TaxID=1333523 RepID=UPI00034234F3|nr:phosphoribosyltransferase family protein [Salinarchaeum sp. Harcht-Bsk1]AGN00029.1 putative phosphoribosyltransferase [Salinarchaeum sp. Harcht-Bsk1]